MAKKKEEIKVVQRRPSFVRRAWSWVWRKKWWVVLIVALLICINIFIGGAKKAQKET